MTWTRLALSLVVLTLAACGGSRGSGGGAPVPTSDQSTVPANRTPADGCALHGTEFDCDGAELVMWLTPTALGDNEGNDIWGWTDPADGTEYALMGLDNGVNFVALTTPLRVAGHLPTQTTTSI